MRLFSLTILAASSLGLAACDMTAGKTADEPAEPGVQIRGAPGDQTVTVTSEDGEQVQINNGGGLPANAPSFVQPYPGAELTRSITSPDATGQMVVFNTDANPDTVIAYYRQRAEESGLQSQTSMTMGETRMYGAESPDGGVLPVMVAPANGQSNVTVTWASQG